MNMPPDAPSEAESVRTVAEYYAARAAEHDLTAGYTDPVAEPLRTPAKVRCRELSRNAGVLEVACGTGYWTEVVAQVARSVLATDVCEGMLALARQRLAAYDNVRFQVADAYSLDGVRGGFNAACAVWWWSYVPKRLIQRFLATLHSRLQPGARVLFVDQLPSAYAPEDQRIDASGDTTEERRAPGGRVYRVVKNFPTEGDVMHALADVATDIEYREFTDECSWSVSYRVAG